MVKRVRTRSLECGKSPSGNVETSRKREPRERGSTCHGPLTKNSRRPGGNVYIPRWWVYVKSWQLNVPYKYYRKYIYRGDTSVGTRPLRVLCLKKDLLVISFLLLVSRRRRVLVSPPTRCVEGSNGDGWRENVGPLTECVGFPWHDRLDSSSGPRRRQNGTLESFQIRKYGIWSPTV